MALGGFVEVQGPQGNRLVELAGDRSTLGRATTNDVVVLLDPSVSRLHAVIERYPTGFCLRDLGSANGTFVNGERVVSEVRIRAGDEIRLGNSRLTFFVMGDDDLETTAVTEGPPAVTRREHELLVALCRP
ncbi:MAG: FHA domain-containing protein, partial [Acidimicrobiia bacterium]